MHSLVYLVHSITQYFMFQIIQGSYTQQHPETHKTNNEMYTKTWSNLCMLELTYNKMLSAGNNITISRIVLGKHNM